ncbi:D-glycero-beta-D-manno-heptose 1,7-bisphosphate 7-phosphatase [Flavobacteriaceae bacterium]|nr:D-glycero-beta-D-manno-heptose 1,7-bisphosphate 7-phosphatase [Flavobacteriaceae bacterium]
MATKAAFLDRDGVINIDHGYVYRWDQFEFIAGVESALHALQESGYTLVIVTNQSGIARGYFTETDFLALSQQLTQDLEVKGIHLAGIYHCPHHPEAGLGKLKTQCDCRKPAPGLILRAARELDIDLTDSILIGDKASDIEAGRRAGVGQLFQITDALPQSGARRVESLAAMTQLLEN